MHGVKPRVVLAEDGVLLREGMIGLLARFDFDVVAAVGDGAALLAAAAEHEPDLVVTDIKMPPTHTDEGLQAAVRLRRAQPGLAIVVLSQYVQQDYAASLLETGDGLRIGYLLKDRIADIDQFVDALRTVLAGGTVVDPDVVLQLARHVRNPLGELSGREREVLGHIAEGHSNSAIATRMHISESAVGKHVGNLFAKLGIPQTDDVNRRVLAVLTYLRSAV